MLLKIFITYYVLSGLLTVMFTKKHWNEVVAQYPHIEILSQNLIFIIQFLVGFFIFPYWFSTYVWIIVTSGFFRLNLGRRAARFNGSVAPMYDEKERIEIRKNRLKELKEKYFHLITIHDMELTKEIHHLLFKTPTIENLETVLLGIVESRDTVMDGWKGMESLYLLTKENLITGICYYLVVGPEKLDLMDGWKITAIIKNPSDENESE